jgi:hypothetical protein
MSVHEQAPQGCVPEIGGDDVLPRVLGPFDAMTVVVGSTAGSIFLKVDVVARSGAFGPIIAVWITVGIVTSAGSLARPNRAMLRTPADPTSICGRPRRLTAFLGVGPTASSTGCSAASPAGRSIYLDRFRCRSKTAALPDFLAEAVPLSHVSRALSTPRCWSSRHQHSRHTLAAPEHHDRRQGGVSRGDQ